MVVRKPLRVIFGAILLSATLLYLAVNAGPTVEYAQSSVQSFRGSHSAKQDLKVKEFLVQQIRAMVTHGPAELPDKILTSYITTEGAFESDGGLTSEELEKHMNLPPEVETYMKTAHQSYMSNLTAKPVPTDLFKNRGIVTVAGGRYFPMMVVLVHFIRQMGNNLPIEVFVADRSEFEPKYCAEVLPTLNAECRVISEIFGEENLGGVDFKGYTLKNLAILASRFDEIYLTDVDSYPIKDLAAVFDNEPFKSKGLVTFPDFWGQTTHPAFYRIAGIELGGRVSGDPEKPLAQEDRKGAMHGKTTESGQLFISKNKHLDTLLLAAYYSIWGKGIYYELLSLDAPGEGDKDTFPAAATVLGKEYFQFNYLGILGTWFRGDYQGFALAHFDPVKMYSELQNGVTELELKERKDNDILALHVSRQKFNPTVMIQEDGELLSYRILGDRDGTQEYLGLDFDMELRLYEITQHMTCELGVKQGYTFLDWEDGDVEGWCTKLTNKVEWLRTHIYEDPEKV